MGDKTRLEKELEEHESTRIFSGVKILVLLMAVCLIAGAAYVVDLQKEMASARQSIGIAEERFEREKGELLNRIKELEEEVARNMSQP